MEVDHKYTLFVIKFGYPININIIKCEQLKNYINIKNN